MKKQAGAILRVSTSKQLEGTSPEKQLEAIRSLAQSQGYELPDGMVWQFAESGASRQRAGFKRALTATRQSVVSRIYVFSVDRLGRDLLEMMQFLRDIEDLGGECWAADRHRPLVWDDFMLQIEGAVASKDRKDIIEKTQDGLKRAIKAGKFSGGIIAYGYELNKESKQLEIEQEEADVIQMMFEWCGNDHMSSPQIADRLNALNILTHYAKDDRKLRKHGKRAPEKTTGLWTPGRVRNMLINTAYKGKWIYGKRSKKPKKELIEATCPAIVSKELFRRAQQTLERNRWIPKNKETRKYLLRGLGRCSECGHSYVGSVSRVASGERRYYRCTGVTAWKRLGMPHKCPSKSIGAEKLEQIVWDDIKAFVQQPEIALEELRAQREPIDATLSEQLSGAKAQIAELQRKERNLIRFEAESENADPQALDDVLKEIRRELASLEPYCAQLENRLASGESLEHELFAVAARLSRLKERIGSASYEEKRRAVEELVKGIEVATRDVNGEKTSIITITYRFEDPGTSHQEAPMPFSVVEDLTLRDSSLLSA